MCFIDIDYELYCHTKEGNKYRAEKLDVKGYKTVLLFLGALLDKPMEEVPDILNFELIEENEKEEKTVRAAEILDDEGFIAYTVLEIMTGSGYPADNF